MPSLSLRINLDPDGRIGPGKIELLEQIAAFGSISAAARGMEMSYKHAWDLVEEMNQIFGKPGNLAAVKAFTERLKVKGVNSRVDIRSLGRQVEAVLSAMPRPKGVLPQAAQ